MSDETIYQIQEALKVMLSNASQEDKVKSSEFLESFQKSQQAWEIVHRILNERSSGDNLQFQFFAAQTLRSKITYDLSQLPESSWVQLKDSILNLLTEYNTRPTRLIRFQLSVALSHLAVQFLNWHGAFEEIVTKLSSSPDLVLCLLDFLRIFPQELDDVKKFSLSDEEYNARCQVLITDNFERVLMLLSELSDAREDRLDCLNNWIKEGSVEKVLQFQPLTDLIFLSLTLDHVFEYAVDCLCTIVKETRDIDNYQIIDALYQQLTQLNKYMHENPDKMEDPKVFEDLTRLYVESAEAWNILIVRNPSHFKPLVEILLECCKYDQDLDVVKYTFQFWEMLKQLLTLPKFQEAKHELADCYNSLVSIIIKHLAYPISDTNNDNDLFGGDKEQEDKFKEFRYEMGDVLKNCCAVLGATKALNIPFQQIQHVISNPQNSAWQHLEAALFSMRTMAKEVSLKERTILPSIMSYLVQLPEHPKIRYSATLVLGRYTEWTSKNPEFLQPQLNYIIKGFEIVKDPQGSNYDQKSLNDIIMATSRALMYFCQDCSSLLVEYLEQLYMLYGQIKGQLDNESHQELVDGLAHVIIQMPNESLYKTTEMFISPTLNNLNEFLNGTRQTGDQDLVDNLEALTTFIKVLRCNDYEKPNYPVADLFISKVWTILSPLLVKFGSSLLVSERLLKLIKSAIQSFSTYLLSILPELANLLHEGFKQYKYGCYLWVSGVLIREYGDEYTSNEIKESVYQFGLSQCSSFFKLIFNNEGQQDIKLIPDVIADYFRMVGDLLMFYPLKLTTDFNLMNSTLKISLLTLNVMNEVEPLITCLHFLIDLLSWGLPNPPISFFEEDPKIPRSAIQEFLMLEGNGAQLLREIINGIIFKFHSDIQQDANDVILKILVVIPDQKISIEWLNEVVATLPNASQQEIAKLINVVSVALPNKDNRRVRGALKEFISWYSRKNVTPRSEF